MRWTLIALLTKGAWGIEFEVYDNAGGHRGDCFVTKTGLIWREGRTRKANGAKVMWDDFINWMNS